MVRVADSRGKTVNWTLRKEYPALLVQRQTYWPASTSITLCTVSLLRYVPSLRATVAEATLRPASLPPDTTTNLSPLNVITVASFNLTSLSSLTRFSHYTRPAAHR